MSNVKGMEQVVFFEFIGCLVDVGFLEPLNHKLSDIHQDQTYDINREKPLSFWFKRLEQYLDRRPDYAVKLDKLFNKVFPEK